jgi:dTDP-4-dehydrorhamnose 3,5-epimerase
MQLINTAIPAVKILEPRVLGDTRGFFMETFNQQRFMELGITCTWVQENHSRSDAGVLRGLHFQRGAAAQDKLVRVVAGRAFDVAVDLRQNSPHFGQWVHAELSASNKHQLFVPRGFAHGFLALEEGTEFCYKCSVCYAPEAEGGLAWNDPTLNIPWPLAGQQPILSERDTRWPQLAQLSQEDLF